MKSELRDLVAATGWHLLSERVVRPEDLPSLTGDVQLRLTYGQDEILHYEQPFTLGEVAINAHAPKHLERPSVLVFKDVTLCGTSGLLFTRSKKILGNFPTPIWEWSIRGDVDRLMLEFARRPGSYVQDHSEVDVACSLVNSWISNYFHWHIDALTRLEGVEAYRELTGLRPKLIVPEHAPSYVLDSIARLGYSLDDVIYATEGRLHIHTLIYPTFRRRNKALSRSACTWLRKRLTNEPESRTSVSYGTRRNVYISRRNARNRRVLNEDAIRPVLADYGFETYTLEDIPYADQISLFSACDVIVAPHGAGLTNIIFATTPNIIELFEEGDVNTCYYHISNSLGGRYSYDTGVSRNGDFEVNVGRLEQLLRRIVSNNRAK